MRVRVRVRVQVCVCVCSCVVCVLACALAYAWARMCHQRRGHAVIVCGLVWCGLDATAEACARSVERAGMPTLRLPPPPPPVHSSLCLTARCASTPSAASAAQTLTSRWSGSPSTPKSDALRDRSVPWRGWSRACSCRGRAEGPRLFAVAGPAPGTPAAFS
jgi:hypothetical protein